MHQTKGNIALSSGTNRCCLRRVGTISECHRPTQRDRTAVLDCGSTRISHRAGVEPEFFKEESRRSITRVRVCAMEVSEATFLPWFVREI